MRQHSWDRESPWRTKKRATTDKQDRRAALHGNARPSRFKQSKRGDSACFATEMRLSHGIHNPGDYLLDRWWRD